MAVFADLDLRAGSDLKALRGLVENAAHRESPWLRGPRCPPSLAAPQAVGPRSGGSQQGRGSFRSPGVSGMSLKADARCGVPLPERGKLEDTGELLPSPAPSFL